MVEGLALALVVAVAAVVGLGILHREALRRVVLGTVDPRPLALFRIALGLCLLGYLAEIVPLADYLFSDEGLLPSAAVSQVYGRGALAGFGDGVRRPEGFGDAWSVVQHLCHGRWSLLYFRDDPAFVHAYLVGLGAAMVGMVIGWHARACTIVVWLMMTGLLRRGDAHWAGEQVFMGLLFPLMLSRCGAAFSVDAWRRNRALAKQQRLDRVDGPTRGRGAPPSDEHPQGLAAIYPRVPAWPQVLIVAQLAICYAANGWTKSGPTWQSGDTLWLSVHMDRYARLDWHELAVALGLWPFRLGTWAVMWWERLFPLVLVGLWMRARVVVGAPPLSARARVAARACWLVLAACVLAWAMWPGALSKDPRVAEPRAWALGLGAVLLAGGVVLGPRLGDRGRSWMLRLLAPKGWLGFGVAFHAATLVLFEIGSFASATVSAYLLCGIGPACVAAVQRVTAALARRGVPMPDHLRGARPIDAEDPTLPSLHRDAAALPGVALAGAAVLVLLGGGLALQPEVGSIHGWHAAWLVAMTMLVIAGVRAARRPAPPSSRPRPLAHGPAGRLAAGGLLVYHLVALLVWQLPVNPAMPWRDRARAMVAPWMELSFTQQLWSMFAPDGPKTNVSLRTVIVDAEGVEHDQHTEQQHPENLPRPYLRHDRWRKVQEGLTGQRNRLAVWHARYLCRRWALDHGGTLPAAVRLERVVARFPPPRSLDAQAWFHQHAVVQPIVTVHSCAAEPFAQPSPEVRARHDLAAAQPGELRYRWPKSPSQPDPLEPLWVLWALGLGAAVTGWSRSSTRATASDEAPTPADR